jgi:formylglycine-generating enzyme required for sulfatase activity
MRISISLFAVGTALALSSAASAITIDWVTVGAPGNAGDTSPKNCGQGFDQPCGSVSYEYQIGKYEVTNTQYAEFLNAVAITDANGLYNTNMNDSTSFGGITRSGASGSYSYAAKPGFENAPVTYVSFFDAARFVNWLQNGQPGGGTQTALTTEDAPTRSRSADSARAMPAPPCSCRTRHEWYKAAYYDPVAAAYFDYPTGTNAAIVCEAAGRVAGTRRTATTGSRRTCSRTWAPTCSPTVRSARSIRGGNVREWHEGIRAAAASPGGSWSDGSIGLSSSYSVYSIANAEDATTGFRVGGIASVPEPGPACS